MIVRNLGLSPYLQTYQAMQEFTSSRGEQSEDEIWLLEHSPVFTMGRNAKPEHLLNPGDIPIEHIDRGGQVTYHGPGQLVAYLLFDIRRRNLGVREFVRLIENSIISLLAQYDIKASGKVDAPGVYTIDGKIAALGLRISKGCSYHGLSLNVDMDLEPFLRINPCGYENLKVVQMSDYQQNLKFDLVSKQLVTSIENQLNQHIGE